MHVNFNFVGLKINTRALGKKLVNPKMLLDYGQNIYGQNILG